MTTRLAPWERRPWPPPARRPVMRQSWRDLLFAHWPVPAEQLRSLVPAALPLDTFDGEAWVSVVPFRMREVTGRALPAFPHFSAFPELNLRTYVTLGGKPGVYFFSLDAGNRSAVLAARLSYRLPYFLARMLVWDDDGWFTYCSHRVHRGAARADFLARYRPTGPAAEGEEAAPVGSLASWLTDRYALYTTHRGRVLRAEIDHRPWPLQPAEAEVYHNTIASSAGIVLPDRAPLLQFSSRVDMLAWTPEPVEPGSGA